MQTERATTEPPPPPPEQPTQDADLALVLPREELAWAQARAEREGRTVAAVVTDIVRKARQDEAWAELLPALLDGQPPLTEEELIAAEREWKG
jgi:hypothetical protein